MWVAAECSAQCAGVTVSERVGCVWNAARNRTLCLLQDHLNLTSLQLMCTFVGRVSIMGS